ncbi:hypothetical protein QBC40DRAFT_272802 [Triangularia verruculosa]|uniref:Uncharacterized protein n=1 Tax=Triangularia verruculosa TaxID=2587418 RepID=A0AAN7B0Y8_9PEZI|nr:hypothetical protein QBC40DRAFT_272802 [Triangularia verruculosa]
MSPTKQSLLSTTTSFCNALASQSPPSTISSYFTTTSPSSIYIFEYGLPQLAPFLGRPFQGPSGLSEYFDLLSKHLSYENMRFSNFFADLESRKVSVRGEARFTWLSTGQSWDEIFTYVLEFDHDSKLVKYEVWADSGAAYLASQGLLDEVKSK